MRPATPFAAILLYTYIYTTVIARSAATWQSTYVTPPPSFTGYKNESHNHSSPSTI